MLLLTCASAPFCPRPLSPHPARLHASSKSTHNRLILLFMASLLNFFIIAELPRIFNTQFAQHLQTFKISVHYFSARLFRDRAKL